MDPTNTLGITTRPLEAFPWATRDPFLFCVHHVDDYPAGNGTMGPATSLEGRDLGQDFAGKDGWRMYHGEKIPGFPQHPHRGFETITVARKGFIDHSDSLGATARYGRGDVQWLTAGSGIVHSEMFPLLEPDRGNPLELFQIWLNLPAESKMVEPHFKMLWGHEIPSVEIVDPQGRKVRVRLAAGALEGETPPAPPPSSWASRPDTGVAVWTVGLEPGATWTLPAATTPGVNRSLYYFSGGDLEVGGTRVRPRTAIDFAQAGDAELRNGEEPAELLLLQGRPIGEPVAQYGPFVMNTHDEIRQAIRDYQRTQFGGWPWPSFEPVHPLDTGRFAKHADGRVEHVSDETV